MVSMMRYEAQRGSWDDFAHVPTKDCLADSLTKGAADVKTLIKTVSDGWLKSIDLYPLFRTTCRNAYYSKMMLRE